MKRMIAINNFSDKPADISKTNEAAVIPKQINSFHITLIIIIALIAYANALGNGFVWDDKYQIITNEYIRDLKNAPLFFTKDSWILSGDPDRSGYYRPLMLFSFAIDFLTWELNPFGYHLTNLFFHILDSLLVFFIAERITKKRGTALLASLFFAVHPIHTESVTFVGGRNDVLSAFFFLLAFLLYINSNYFASLISFSLALLSKETALVLPIIIIIYDILIEGNTLEKLKEKTKTYSSYFAITALYLLLRFFVLGISSPTRSYYGGNFYHTILTMSKVFVKYVQITLVPAGMTIYPNITVSNSIFEPAVLFSILLLVALAVVVGIVYKHEKIVAFSIVWFFTALLPVSNIIPITVLMAERYLYLPSFGFCLLMAVIFDGAINKFPQNKNMVVLLSAILILFYTGATIDRNFDWKDDFTLWSRTLEVSPYSSDAHLNMGHAYEDKTLFDLAISEYKQAIELDPTVALAYSNLGTAYAATGEYDLAIKALQRSIALSPRNPKFYKILGRIYYERGEYDLAIEEFTKASLLVVLDIETIILLADSHNELGIIYGEAASYDLAIAEFKKAIEVEPESAEIYANLGTAYASIFEYELARNNFKKAIELDPANEKYKLALERLTK